MIRARPARCADGRVGTPRAMRKQPIEQPARMAVEAATAVWLKRPIDAG